MSNPWFRMYAEFAHDPKVQMLSEVMQRRYIMLMCMRCSNVTVTLRDDEIAFQLRITDAELAETKALFVKKGFISNDWNLLNWEKRQFVSDHDPSGAERQKRFREKKRNALRNAPEPKDNARVTLPDTDTDTDINTPLPPKGVALPESPEPAELPGFANFWATWPTNDRKQAKGKCLQAWKRANAEPLAELVLAHIATLKASAWLKDGGQFVPAPLVYLNQRRWEGASTDEAPARQWEGAL